MKSNKKTKIIIVLAVLILASVAGSLAYEHFRKTNLPPDVPSGWVPEKDFRYVPFGQATCEAITPDCGTCYGKVIDKVCYVEPGSRYAQ